MNYVSTIFTLTNIDLAVSPASNLYKFIWPENYHQMHIIQQLGILKEKRSKLK